MPDRATPDKGFRYLMHLNRALHPGVHPLFFQRILQRQRIDYRGQHAHKIAGGAIDLKTFLPRATKNISATHHNGHFHA